MRIAAIDVGSNALKMTVAETDLGEVVDEIIRRRAPVRLGTDVFTRGALQPETLDNAVAAFEEFRDIILEAGAERVRAVATSAVRDAANGAELVARIADRTGINLEVIEGEEEAALVMASVSDFAGDPSGHEIVFDIGGGSLEVIVARDGKPTALESFPLGAVRLLTQLVDSGKDERHTADLLADMSHRLRALISEGAGNEPIRRLVATGGSAKFVPKLARKILVREVEDRVSVSELAVLADCVASWSIEERIEKFDLRQDRADIMVIALEVLHWAAGLTGAVEMQVCSAGLRHGLLLALARDGKPNTAKAPETNGF